MATGRWVVICLYLYLSFLCLAAYPLAAMDSIAICNGLCPNHFIYHCPSAQTKVRLERGCFNARPFSLSTCDPGDAHALCRCNCLPGRHTGGICDHSGFHFCFICKLWGKAALCINNMA